MTKIPSLMDAVKDEASNALSSSFTGLVALTTWIQAFSMSVL